MLTEYRDKLEMYSQLYEQVLKVFNKYPQDVLDLRLDLVLPALEKKLQILKRKLNEEETATLERWRDVNSH